MNSPIQEKPHIRTDTVLLGGREIDILRLDLIHPQISGNKWYKLKYNLRQAIDTGKPILTFGGAYSNHIAAVAAAGAISNVPTIGVIRGESTYRNNPTLSTAEKQGMKLHFVSREVYRNKDSADLHDQLREKFGDFLTIPEGGSNAEGVKGASEILDETSGHYDLVACAVGTGGTLAGLITHRMGAVVLGISTLKGANYLEGEIATLSGMSGRSEWMLNHHYHFGGYAKFTPDLIRFLRDFHQSTSIRLDPIYTGKLLFAVNDLIISGDLNHDRILVLHTGGLQGIAGFEQRHKFRLFD